MENLLNNSINEVNLSIIKRAVNELETIHKDSQSALDGLKEKINDIKKLPDLNEVVMVIKNLDNIKKDVEMLEEKIKILNENMNDFNNCVDNAYSLSSKLYLDLLDMSTVEKKLNEVSEIGRQQSERPYFHEMAIIVSRFATRCEKIVLGTINDQELEPTDPYYHNNFKYYYDQLVKNNLIKEIVEE